MTNKVWPDAMKAMMIRQARRHLRMNQRDFAEMLGTYAPTVCQWETGRRIPRGPTWQLFLLLVGAKGIKFDNNGVLAEGKKNKAA